MKKKKRPLMGKKDRVEVKKTRSAGAVVEITRQAPYIYTVHMDNGDVLTFAEGALEYIRAGTV